MDAQAKSNMPHQLAFVIYIYFISTYKYVLQAMWVTKNLDKIASLIPM